MADVIIADGKLTPHASVSQVTLDWACGTDENDFELTIEDPSAPEIERGWYFWIDGSDVGGRIVDRRVAVSGGVSTATWIGQSWTGMLAAKILQPDANQDYLTVSGKLPDILKSLLKRIGLDSVFTVDSSDASTLSNWMFQNPRYVDAYTGFRNLLASCGRRLDFQAKDNHILLGITPVGIIDNTIDSDLVDFKAETNRRAVNHLIGLGSQELKNRLVVNYFADATGVVSQTQTLVGADEVCATYDYSNADLGTLQSETKKHLQELQTGGSVEVSLSDEVGDGLRVDDKIVAADHASGVNVTAVVTKRIVKIDSGILASTFEVGLPVQSANANYSGSSSSSSGSTGGVFDGWPWPVDFRRHDQRGGRFRGFGCRQAGRRVGEQDGFRFRGADRQGESDRRGCEERRRCGQERGRQCEVGHDDRWRAVEARFGRTGRERLHSAGGVHGRVGWREGGRFHDRERGWCHQRACRRRRFREGRVSGRLCGDEHDGR